ncbi:hypothetical protein QR680_005583 [Steinernema hermaphroditum]|uniref:Autophagy-related protein 9 n=1 Tax=Steinernema hermaphroditum TaxID=289476 RepID=A0AA39LVX3_9BILA|nr:hypothetical protein QR680_005583 [Steinernema hermaphroditum]
MDWLLGKKKHYQTIDGDYDDPENVGTSSTYGTAPSYYSIGEAPSVNGSHMNSAGNDIYGSPPQLHQIQASSTTHGDRRDSFIASSSGNGDQRWDHIEDLDQFFTRIYEYHQGGGFRCISLKHSLDLLQFIFIVCFATFWMQCIDYDLLFKKSNTTIDGVTISGKTHFSDVVISDCPARMNIFVIIAILVALLFWLYRLIRVATLLTQFSSMQRFYRTALGVPDDQLHNFTWNCIVKKVCNIQSSDHKLVINRDEIDELDVYQRILRYENYFVAMVNKDILPVYLNIPFLGAFPYFPDGLKLNLEYMLFWGHWSPWEGPYSLKREYKQPRDRERCVAQMRETMLWVGIVNIVLLPLIFIYQILYGFFSLAEMIKRDPGVLGTRKYSNYGRMRIRHFNELEHELHQRLNRSYDFAVKYTDQFVNRGLEIVARNVAFVAASIFFVLTGLTMWDEDVIAVSHVLTVLAACGAVVMCCRPFIGNENMVFSPDWFMGHIIAQIHYAPPGWKENAHTDEVQRGFGQLFQLRPYVLLVELLSPVITPFVILFDLRPRAHRFVDFFMEHSTNIEGLGDVCTFATMEVARHGDPVFQASVIDPEPEEEDEDEEEQPDPTSISSPMRDGKTEMSLMHFAAVNPEWNPPASSQRFLERFKKTFNKDVHDMREAVNLENNLLRQSIFSLVPMSLAPHLAMAGGEGSSAAMLSSVANNFKARDGFTRMEGPPRNPATALCQAPSLTESLRQSGVVDPMNALRMSQIHTNEIAAEMSLNALYLYGLRSRKMGLERSAADGSSYGSFRGAGADLFSVPDRSAMYDAMQSTSGLHQHQRSHLIPGGIHASIVEEQGDEDAAPATFPTA